MTKNMIVIKENVLVTVDVNLLTNIPLKETLKIIENRLILDTKLSERT